MPQKSGKGREKRESEECKRKREVGELPPKSKEG